MLFTLVMDVVNCLFEKANGEVLLQPLATRNIHHYVFLYADDVVLFLRPVASDLRMVVNLLQLFGSSTGLKTNIQKSNVLPIQCSDDDVAIVQAHLPCDIQVLPCKYLGLHFSIRKLNRAQLQAYINKIADQLLGWKAELLNRAGRAKLVKHVLTAMLIHIATALDLPPWCLKAVDKLRQNFLWRGRKKANVGHCLIAWPKVSRPKELGGLGICQTRDYGSTYIT
jgi:hypothetical protein